MISKFSVNKTFKEARVNVLDPDPTKQMFYVLRKTSSLMFAFSRFLNASSHKHPSVLQTPRYGYSSPFPDPAWWRKVGFGANHLKHIT